MQTKSFKVIAIAGMMQLLVSETAEKENFLRKSPFTMYCSKSKSKSKSKYLLCIAPTSHSESRLKYMIDFSFLLKHVQMHYHFKQQKTLYSIFVGFCLIFALSLRFGFPYYKTQKILELFLFRILIQISRFPLKSSYCPFKLLCESLTRQLFWIRRDFRDFFSFNVFNVCLFHITCQPLCRNPLAFQTKRKSFPFILYL